MPTTSLPPKFSWLGANEIPTELPSGVLDMGARSYVPQLGRFLQPDPKPGGSANAYTYTFGDPVNSSDPSGESAMPSSWSIGTSAAQASESAAVRAAEIRAAEEAAKRAAEEATARMIAEANAQQAYWDSLVAGPQYGGEEEWGEEEWWEWEEEEEYENAAYRHGESGKEEGHLENGVLYQPLTEGSGSNEDQEGSEKREDVGGFRGSCQGNASCKRYHKSHPIGSGNGPSGSVCYGIAAVTTLAGPELSVPRWIGFAIFGVCGG